MKRLIPILALLALACGGSDSTGPAKGTLVFKIDALTCTGSGTINFFIDGTIVGTETVSAGGSSRGYSTTAGQHVVGASEVGNGFTWTNQTVTVPANGTYTDVLACPS